MQPHQQRRRRPASLGVSRQSHEEMAFDVTGIGFRQRDRNIGRASRQFTLPSFRGTYIPESLLAGPPPPPLSIEPRRASVSTATLATLPSMSPILTRAPQDEPGVMSHLGSESPVAPVLIAATIQTTSAAGSTSMTASIISFEEYRFPDERSPSFSNFGQNVTQHARVSTQRAIHPLSPLHPDYRHPDDLYNASIPSPNEDGPVFASMEGFSRGNANVPIGFKTASRRESRPAIFAVEPPLVTATTTSFGKNTTGSMKRSTPELRIVTAIKTIVPPPQIPIPTLPMTPFSSTMAAVSSLTDI
ncbi:hypothetical protein BGZ99_001483 [Dissophora globulifera]|uniref:Uncharacterized protein n=1 Tax=Dissophora globulifera TaxID=979702 RepID=A0A9P6R0X8_9FUNG|nr:hypothetical protein BGZ99_001483 [Dissophora globulifera]